MVRTWPASARARLSAQVSTVRTWPSSIRARVPRMSTVGTWPASVRVRISAQLIGEIVLGGLLVATLAFSPRDGIPSDGYDPAVWSTQAGARFVAPAVRQPSFALTLPSMSNLSAWASTTGTLTAKALIPTAPPAQLLIPSIRVHRPVEGVGLDRRGVMNLPVNSWNAGWFNSGPVPGAPGDAVIEGHAGYPGEPMIFGKLGTLRHGEKIIVVLSDGSQHLFLVESMAVLPVGAAPPGMAEPFGPPRLTLITCTGHFDEDNKFYSQRLIVEASYAGIV
jgi:hypothetical protein